jgi:hypothetical protein
VDIFDHKIEEFPYNLLVTTDVHLGHSSTDENKIGEILKRVEPYMLPSHFGWIDLGDKCSLIGTQDLRRWDGYYPKWLDISRVIDSQIDRFEIIFEPLMPYCLFMVRGTHEESIRKQTGHDPHREILDRFNTAGVNSYSCLADFHLVKGGKTRDTLRVYAHHGYVTGKYTDNNIMNRYIKNSLNIEADLYLYGHSHALTYRDDIIGIRKVRNKIKAFRKTIVICGGYQKTYESGHSSYVEIYGASPKDLGSVLITIDLDHKRNKKVDITLLR